MTQIELDVIRVQYMYCARPYLHVREEFFDAMVRNIKALALAEEAETRLLALAILACRRGKGGRAVREHASSKALDMLDVIGAHGAPEGRTR